MSDDPRWWKLYREERAKLLPGRKGWKVVATAQQITHAAREATRRFNEPDDAPPTTEAAPKPPTPSSDPAGCLPVTQEGE